MGLLEKFYNDSQNNPDRQLYDFMDCSTEEYTHNIVTVKEAWEKSRDIAGELKAKGAKKGDRAVILCMQDEGTVYAIWGCMIAGVIFTVVPPPIDEGKVSRLISVLKSCSPKFLISNEGLEKSQGGKAKTEILKGALKAILSLKRIYTDKIKSHPEFTGFNPFNADDIAYLQYTSGSTSEPKGVMVSHGNILSCLDQCQEIYDFKIGHHNLCSWVPFYHNIGLIVAIILPITVDIGISYFIPTLQFLARPTVWLKVISDYKINITAAPNSAYEVITQIVSEENAKNYDLSHVTMFINGSEFVDVNTVDKFSRLFNISKDSFAPGYGLSECVCVATLSASSFKSVKLDSEAYRNKRFVPAEDGDKTIVSVGSSAGDMVIKAVTEDGHECEPGQIGEIYISSSSVCKGYYKNPEETKRFHAKISGDEREYYATGDMGCVYEGQVYLTGRIKEMIIISGKNLFPNDIISSLSDLDIGISGSSTTVFSVQHEGVEAPVLCAEMPEDITESRAGGIVNKINHRVSEMFGFSFKDIVFVKTGDLSRTDNRKIKTLDTKRRYTEDILPAIYSMQNGALLAGGAGTMVINLHFSIKESLEDIKASIRNVFAKFINSGDFKDSDSFLELGADSLTLTRLVSALEDGCGKPLDLRTLIDDPSINGISQYVFKCMHPEEISSEASGINLYEECKLPDNVLLEGKYEISPRECKNIFLTGATGFLGAYTIVSLIKQRADLGIHIYAHARAASKEAAMMRIEENLKRFNCYKPEYMTYITPVIGELTKPKLGIKESEYNELSEKIDMVIHNGAVLNFLLTYSKLKDANVTGTVYALEFAMKGRAKYFEYISSYSVYDNPAFFKKTVSEDDPLERAEGYFLGYSETKWVSEKLVSEAAKRGLRTVVFRPGDITGTMEDGIWKLEDLISRSIVGCIQLGAMPDMDVHLHLTPVDYVADSIAHIAFLDESTGHGFNIINNFTRPMADISRLMKKYGYNLDVLPYSEWCRLLSKTPPEENVLRVLSCLFTDKKPKGENLNERFGEYQARFSTENCDRLLAGTNIKCPPMSEKMFVAYLNNFHNAGYIKKPVKKLFGGLF